MGLNSILDKKEKITIIDKLLTKTEEGITEEGYKGDVWKKDLDKKLINFCEDEGILGLENSEAYYALERLKSRYSKY